MAINGKRVLAVIPARGGSKRVPRKNLREFRGKPLLLWTIEQARASALVDDILVSTEDAEIKTLKQRIVELERDKRLMHGGQ